MQSVPRSYFILHTSYSKKTSEQDNDGPAREQIRGAHEDRDLTRRKLTKRRDRIPSALLKENPDEAIARVITTEGFYYVLRVEDGSEIRARTYKGTRSANPNATLVAIGDN